MTYSFAPNNQPLYVREGDYIQFKFKAPSTWDTTLTVTIQIGELTQFWSIITVPEDFTPDPFPLESVENADLDTMYYYADGLRPSESLVVVSGLTESTQAGVEVTSNIGVPDGEAHTDYYGMRIDFDGDGIWDTGTAATDYYITTETGPAPTVENGAIIQIKGKTKSFENQKTRVTLRIGTAFENWDITTKPIPVNKPEPFPEFEDLFDQPLGTYVYTNEVLQVTGLFEDGTISISAGAEYALSNTANTVTNGDGFDVLDGVTWQTSGTVSNGQYLQLRLLTPTSGNTPTNATLNIASGDGSVWQVTTGDFPSSNPDSFDFPPRTNINLNTLTASAARPVGGITGLGTGVSVPVSIVSTDSDDVRIKINDGSIGYFTASTTVSNGDEITLYVLSSDTTLDTKNLSIQVGSRVIPAFQVQTFAGPDDTPSEITPPANRNNVIPNTYITSTPVTIEGINVPVTITSSNVNSLLSIDYDTPVAGPRTFDPAINTSFRIVLLSATNLNTPEDTEISIGTTGATNNPFTWTVRTYPVAPPAATNLGVWYSKKNEKEEGYTIGTVLPILKENLSGYGDLDGNLGDRFPGFVVCDGRDMDPELYPELYEIIGTTYGGSVSESNTSQSVTQTRNGITYTTTINTKSYSGTFKLPDYRNRRMCGTGIVDSARGNSAFLPISNSKTIIEPGAEGGYWYFDKVDPFGPEPLEQIQGTGNTGLDSEFYSLGTVRVAGTDSITDNVPFTISGFVTATIGELQEVIVATPEHDHQYFAAVPESADGYPMIAWGNVDNGRSMFRTGPGGDGGNDWKQHQISDLDPGGTEDNPTNIRAGWVELLNSNSSFTGGNGNFEQALQAYYGDDWDGMANFVELYFGIQMTGENTAGAGENIDGFDDEDTATFEISFYTWWISDLNALSSATLQGTKSGHACVFDLRPATFTVDNFLPAGGTTLGHSHLMTLDPVSNFQTDFTGGNFPKAGQGGAYGAGLGNGDTTQTVIFTQSDIFMEMTEGTFEFSRAFATPVPDVTMRPQSQAPILVPFHKAKYIIKAF